MVDYGNSAAAAAAAAAAAVVIVRTDPYMFRCILIIFVVIIFASVVARCEEGSNESLQMVVLVVGFGHGYDYYDVSFSQPVVRHGVDGELQDT